MSVLPVPEAEHLQLSVAHGDVQFAHAAALAAHCSVQTFGRTPDADWAADPIFNGNPGQLLRCDNTPAQIFGVR